MGEHVISTAVSAVRDNIRDIYFVGRDALKFSPTLLRFLACCFVRGVWSSLGPPNVITLLSQKRIGNYSAKLIAKTITGRAAGGVITTPRSNNYSTKRLTIERYFCHGHGEKCNTGSNCCLTPERRIFIYGYSKHLRFKLCL